MGGLDGIVWSTSCQQRTGIINVQIIDAPGPELRIFPAPAVSAQCGVRGPAACTHRDKQLCAGQKENCLDARHEQVYRVSRSAILAFALISDVGQVVTLDKHLISFLISSQAPPSHLLQQLLNLESCACLLPKKKKKSPLFKENESFTSPSLSPAFHPIFSVSSSSWTY